MTDKLSRTGKVEVYTGKQDVNKWGVVDSYAFVHQFPTKEAAIDWKKRRGEGKIVRPISGTVTYTLAK